MGYTIKVYLATDVLKRCLACPLLAENVTEEEREGGGCIPVIGENFMDNSDRRTICRYVLKQGGDFIGYDDARRLIADALTVLGKDDAREKFLGKAKDRPHYYVIKPISTAFYRGFDKDCGAFEVRTWPVLKYMVAEENGGHIAAFRDEDTARKVAEFLNDA